MNLYKAQLIDRYTESKFDEQEAAQIKLKELANSMESLAPAEQAAVMKFLCQDQAFANLTGGDYRQLQKISGSMERETVGSIVTLLLTNVFGWRLWHWVDQKTPTGLNAWYREQGRDQLGDVDILARTARAPMAKDFAVLQAGLSKGCELINKIASGRPISDADIAACAKSLNIGFDMSKFDNYTGHLVAFLATLGVNYLYLVGMWLIVVLAACIGGLVLALPAAIFGGLMAAFKSSATYKRVYESMTGEVTLGELGYSIQSIRASFDTFLNHYQLLRQYSTKLDRLSNHGVLTIPSTEAGNRLHALCDMMYYGFKAEARVLGTIAAVSGNMGPTDFSD